MQTKVCFKCKVEKPISEFHVNKRNKDGFKGTCKECCAIYVKEHRDEANEWSRKNRYKYRDKQNAYLRKYRKGDKHKARMERKKDELKEYARKYRSTDEFKRKEHERYLRTKEKYRAKREETQKKYESLPEIKAKKALRARLNTILARSHGSKSDKIIALIGCTMPEFKKHFESLFTEGMSWDNYGWGYDKWTIDHIKPCALFDLTDPAQQRECFNYANLRPMWFKDNMSKNSLYEGEYIRKKKS